jgi:ubiquitin-like-conjugating enzyme ATG3
MLKIVQELQECNQTPTVEQYLFIFLKFIQSVVPTIEYDYTIDVQAARKVET